LFVPDKRKTLAFPARVRGVGGRLRLAALVPRPSVPPGAGNKPKKAYKAKPKGVEQGGKGNVEAGRFDGHLDAATVRRHDDGDTAAIPTIQIEQQRPPGSAVSREIPRCPGSLAGNVDASTAPK
jgi:hypothetical protein